MKSLETLKEKKNDFTCVIVLVVQHVLSVDYSATPRPLYRSDGLKNFDIHSEPLSIRDEIKKDLGDFHSSLWVRDGIIIKMDCRSGQVVEKNINPSQFTCPIWITIYKDMVLMIQDAKKHLRKLMNWQVR